MKQLFRRTGASSEKPHLEIQVDSVWDSGLPVVGVVDGIDGDVEVTDAVPGWQGDVQEDNLQEIDASSLVRKFFNVTHLLLDQSNCPFQKCSCCAETQVKILVHS